MSNKELTLDLDLSEIRDLADKLTNKLKDRVDDAIYLLTAQASAHIKELAQERLKTRKDLFLENLSEPEQVENGVWVITLFEKAVWIDDGQAAYDLKEVMLRSKKTKTGKNGRYIDIPFKHSKSPSKRGVVDQALVETLKVELKKRGGFFKKIETGANGKPLLGKIHSFDIDMKHPLNRLLAAHRIGSKMQGPAGRPYLYGVRVYQRESLNKAGQKTVRKDIFTFRRISENSNPNSWKHPGTDGARIFDDTYEWASNQWQAIEDQLIQDILG